MTGKIARTVYEKIDRERIIAALDNGNRYDATVLLKYSALTKEDFDELIENHPNFKGKVRTYTEFWTRVLERATLKVAQPSFDTWFKNTDGVKDEGNMIVYCENEFQRDWLENEYEELIQTIASKISAEELHVSFELKA